MSNGKCNFVRLGELMIFILDSPLFIPNTENPIIMFCQSRNLFWRRCSCVHSRRSGRSDPTAFIYGI